MTEIAIKHDTGKAPLSLIPYDAMVAEAAVLAFGKQKYSAWNWTNGFEWSRVADAALRHVYAWIAGQDYDPETGLLHTAHARTNLGFLITHQVRGLGKDDRHPFLILPPEKSIVQSS